MINPIKNEKTFIIALNFTIYDFLQGTKEDGFTKIKSKRTHQRCNKLQ